LRAVTRTKIHFPSCEVTSVYGAAVAPRIGVQPLGAIPPARGASCSAPQRSHAYAYVGDGVPVQVPELALRRLPTVAVPVTDGAAVFTGAESVVKSTVAPVSLVPIAVTLETRKRYEVPGVRPVKFVRVLVLVECTTVVQLSPAFVLYSTR
jgi:hypothetical protein